MQEKPTAKELDLRLQKIKKTFSRMYSDDYQPIKRAEKKQVQDSKSFIKEIENIESSVKPVSDKAKLRLLENILKKFPNIEECSPRQGISLEDLIERVSLFSGMIAYAKNGQFTQEEVQSIYQKHWVSIEEYLKDNKISDKDRSSAKSLQENLLVMVSDFQQVMRRRRGENIDVLSFAQLHEKFKSPISSIAHQATSFSGKSSSSLASASQQDSNGLDKIPTSEEDKDGLKK